MTSVEIAISPEQTLAAETSADLVALQGRGSEEQGPVVVDHVVDSYHRYPGEMVTLLTRVAVREPISDLSLSIAIPEGLTLGEYQVAAEMAATTPTLQSDEGRYTLVWPLAGELEPGSSYEYRTEARVLPVERNAILESRALVTGGARGVLAEGLVSIAVWAKGRYLRYLPELYDGDELMGRFLMLFESFWAPLETQIDGLSCYFGPGTTPARFLPWLASWLGLELDARLPEERQRALIRSAIWLYRRRGTKQALKEYLEIYTGGQVKIVEHRASNFRLGSQGTLGRGVALGTGNQPHTFTVYLEPPPAPATDGEAEDHRQEERLRRTAQAIIEAEKPAHTDYTLVLGRGL